MNDAGADIRKAKSSLLAHFGRSKMLTAFLALTAIAGATWARAPIRVRPLPAERLPDGRVVSKWRIQNESGAGLTVMNLGAVIQTLTVPDKSGKLDDIVYGYDKADAYLTNPPYFGAAIGRFANRIAKGKFSIGQKHYQLAVNNGLNALHGGVKGYDKQLWTGTNVKTREGAGVRFSRISPNGEEGYPGTVKVSVTYIWTADNRLIIDYGATSDAETPFNISQHSYFNLGGASSSVLATDHQLQIHADSYTPVDETLIPTGASADVSGTPFDFRTAKPIGRDIGQPHTQLKFGGGYDHNFVLNGKGLREAAVLDEPVSGRRMTVSTDQPGVQFYSSNFLDGGLTGKTGKHYPYRGGVVLETQHFPDSPNQPQFPNAILAPGKPFHSRTIFAFSTDK